MSKIKLINKTKDIEKLKMKPMNWDIVINGVPYYACFIEGYVHSIGGGWGENNIWCYPRDEKPSFDNLIEYQGKSPVNWGIKYEPTLTLKTKWGETRAQTNNSVIVTRNGKDFYYCYSIAQAQVILEEIDEHPLNLNEIDFDKKAIGRKIWWRSQPAVIKRFIWGSGTIAFEPEGDKNFEIPKEFGNEQFYYEGERTITTSIFDKHIWWFRD